MILVDALFWLLYGYLAVSVVYILLFAFFGRIIPSRKIPSATAFTRFAVFIPTYKADEVIYESATDALNQDYPKDKFEVIAICDKVQPETIEKLRQHPLTVLPVSFDQSTKSKSLNAAFNALDASKFDHVVILDVDNHMAPDFLRKINDCLQYSKAKAVQGHRVAKNLDTELAILDAISEEVNNHIFRKGHRALGLSSALIGSAMAFDYAFMKEVMAGVKAVGGFDKELEMKLLKDRYVIEYVPDALCYDEKVQKTDAFQNQRRRWLSAQWVYVSQNLLPGIKHFLLSGNVDYFDKVFQNMLLPRVMLLGLCGLLFGLSLFLPLPPSPQHWQSIFGLLVFTFLLSVPASFYNLNTLKASMLLPKTFLLIFKTLFKLKGANKTFIHTPHSTTPKKDA